MPAVAERPDKLAALKEETRTLNSVSVATILADRYGATKDGPETMATIKGTNQRVRQQKWRLEKGHHINVCENNAWCDLLDRKGGGGAIGVVEHLERCDFKRAREMLRTWYPDFRSFAGKAVRAASADQPAPELELEKPVVLPKFRRSTHDDPKHRRDYELMVHRYLCRERGLPRDIVDQAMAANKVYPTEKTALEIVKNPAGEKFVGELAALYRSKNWQFSSRDTGYEDGQPLLITAGGRRVPGIRFRAETRPELKALIATPPVYKLPGSDDEFRPEIANAFVQCEVAFPIQRFFSNEPVATSVRSLKGSFKQSVGPKTQGAFAWGQLTPETERLVLTESGVEALSYVALKRVTKGTCVWGINGSGNIDEVFPFLNAQGITVVNAFNNEGAGRKFAEKIREKGKEFGVEVVDEFPPGGEVHVESDDDEENRKYFERLRDAARAHRVRFLEKVMPAEGGKPQRCRMRLESHGEIWKLLDLHDPVLRRKAQEAKKAGLPTEGIVHFRETATIEPICKDWNDVMRGEPKRVFTTEFARTYDQQRDHMKPPPEVEAKVSPSPAEPSAAEKQVEQHIDPPGIG